MLPPFFTYKAMIMDKVGPISFPLINLRLTDENDRQSKNFALSNSTERDAQEKKKDSENLQDADYATIKEYIAEINMVLSTLGYALTIVLEKDDEIMTISILNTSTGEKVRAVSVQEIVDLAQNLRNQKMTLIAKDA